MRSLDSYSVQFGILSVNKGGFEQRYTNICVLEKLSCESGLQVGKTAVKCELGISYSKLDVK